MLKQHQARFKTKTHDETIRALFQQTYRPIASLRGALKHVKEEFKRDEYDRFA